MIITDSEAAKEQIQPFEQAGIRVEKPEKQGDKGHGAK